MATKNLYKDLLATIPKKDDLNDVQKCFVTDLERQIVLQEERRPPSRTLKPSGIGGCAREQVFTLLGVEMDNSLGSAFGIGITDIGTFRHDKLQTAIMNSKDESLQWIDVEEYIKQNNVNTVIKERKGNEVKCYNPTYNISFMCDGIIKYRGEYYILEIKTEEVNKHNARFVADPKHVNQATVYSMCLGISKIMFLYEDRNLCHKKAFVVEVTSNDIHLMIKKLTLLLNYAKAGMIPPKEKKCTYCKYKSHCKVIGDTYEYSSEQLQEIIEERVKNEQGKKEEEQSEKDR